MLLLATDNRRPPVKKKRKKKKQNKQNLIIYALSAAIIAVALFTIITVVVTKTHENEPGTTALTTDTQDEKTTGKSNDKNDKTSESGTTLSIENNVTSESADSSESVSATTSETTTSKPKLSESGRIIVDTSVVKWNLMVVNLTREIPEGYRPEVVEVVNSGHDLDKRVAPHYEDMYYAAKKEGIILTPFSGNRSYERQRINYNNLTETYMARYGIDRKAAQKKAATVILPPGTSEHNIGLAMDICNTYDSFANTKEYAWLTKNAYKYGFILRYPKGKEDITGVVYEPWHWRYVGKEYAKKIRDSGLCLEEYLDSVGIAY